MAPYVSNPKRSINESYTVSRIARTALDGNNKDEVGVIDEILGCEDGGHDNTADILYTLSEGHVDNPNEILGKKKMPNAFLLSKESDHGRPLTSMVEGAPSLVHNANSVISVESDLSKTGRLQSVLKSIISDIPQPGN